MNKLDIEHKKQVNYIEQLKIQINLLKSAVEQFKINSDKTKENNNINKLNKLRDKFENSIIKIFQYLDITDENDKEIKVTKKFLSTLSEKDFIVFVYQAIDTLNELTGEQKENDDNN